VISERTKDSVLQIALIIVIVTLIVNSMTGCAAYQATNRVPVPPREFQGPSVAKVEFVQAESVLFRCIDAGPSVACTHGDRITITNPCDYPDQAYARLLCHEMAHVNLWPADHSNPKQLPWASESPEALALAKQEVTGASNE